MQHDMATKGNILILFCQICTSMVSRTANPCSSNPTSPECKRAIYLGKMRRPAPIADEILNVEIRFVDTPGRGVRPDRSNESTNDPISIAVTNFCATKDMQYYDDCISSLRHFRRLLTDRTPEMDRAERFCQDFDERCDVEVVRRRHLKPGHLVPSLLPSSSTNQQNSAEPQPESGDNGEYHQVRRHAGSGHTTAMGGHFMPSLVPRRTPAKGHRSKEGVVISSGLSNENILFDRPTSHYCHTYKDDYDKFCSGSQVKQLNAVWNFCFRYSVHCPNSKIDIFGSSRNFFADPPVEKKPQTIAPNMQISLNAEDTLAKFMSFFNPSNFRNPYER